jgi:hypothetical protein
MPSPMSVTLTARVLNPRFLSHMASYDVASDLCLALNLGDLTVPRAGNNSVYVYASYTELTGNSGGFGDAVARLPAGAYTRPLLTST